LIAGSSLRCDSALVWFRRDLRSRDHAALAAALRDARRVYCAFVFDRDILDALQDHSDRRVEFIWESVQALHSALALHGGGLIVLHDHAREAVASLAVELGVAAVYVNRDYEPDAIARDADVARRLGVRGIDFRPMKDQVIFEPEEIRTRDGQPYAVYTPYKNAWLKALRDVHTRPQEVDLASGRLVAPAGRELPSLEAIGFARTNLRDLPLPTGMAGADQLWDDFRGRIGGYAQRRDFPAANAPSYLSVHLRFGTISIRQLVREVAQRSDEGARAWLSELIWREFYFMVLYYHPRVVSAAFRHEFDAIRFPGSKEHFDAWCSGRTGYPLVDAAMHQLDTTGYMHNRLRMVTASFLVKDLHVDWRLGERYFARKLNDYDLAANNGGWQWAASTGCDAQPYFRIFNPITQSERFDPGGAFIRRYLPVLARVPTARIHAPWRMSEGEQREAGVIIGHDYPAPLVDHEAARRLTLALFGKKGREAPADPARQMD